METEDLFLIFKKERKRPKHAVNIANAFHYFIKK